MTRPIKFRVWIGDSFEYNVLAGKHGAYFHNVEADCITRYNAEAEQFWKQDKNGNDIYAGDLVMFDFWSKPLEVKQSENGFYVEANGQQSMPYSQHLELIGNIHTQS